MRNSTTAERLKYILNTRNLKQSDILRLAEPFVRLYGVPLNKNDLSQYVSGKVKPGQYKITILAKTLNVAEAWLMGYDVPMLDGSTEKAEEHREQQKKSTLDELTSRVRVDDEFCSLIVNITQLNPEQLASVKQIVDVMLKA